MWSGREYKSLLVAKNNKKPVLAATAVIDRLRAVAGRLFFRNNGSKMAGKSSPGNSGVS